MLKKIVEDRTLAWDATSVNSGDLYFRLDDRILSSGFDRKETDRFRLEHLDSGIGIGIIALQELTNDPSEMRKIYSDIVRLMGTPLSQNNMGEELVEIKNRGKTMKEGGRYHETKEGGSLHTDCPQWDVRPDYVGMLCLQTARSGGVGKYISAYSVHNTLLRERSDLVPLLYDRYHFDKRRELVGTEEATIHYPIIEYLNEKLSFRYLSEYVRDGQNKAAEPLSYDKTCVIKILDEVLSRESLMVEHQFSIGDALFLNNYRVAHGRSSYEDYSDENRRRLLLRSWIKR